jgi:HEAT repeats
MSVFRPNPPGLDAPEQDAPGQNVPGKSTPRLDETAQNASAVPQAPDPRLQPTPDYGTLAPNSDIASSYAASSAPAAGPSNPRRSAPANVGLLRLIAVICGVVGALVASHAGPAAWDKIAGIFAPQKKPAVSSAAFSQRDLDRQKPQRQAEILLTRAVSRSDGATDAIQSRIEGWRGKLELNPQLSQLTTAALNSEDVNVRASAIEVQLAAYGLEKNDSTVDTMVRQADSSNHAQKIWALWALGLLGNRGVETDRVVQVLTAHLQGSGKDSARDRDRDRDEEARHWAVEGLALVGTNSTIAPLLEAMHNDPSALVRERAACSLAESGMLTHEQRLTAVPQLITYSDDPALDAQTHAWAFQALSDITKQRLPNDSAAWRNWFQNSVASGQ